ncbi:poly-gamma-glutamate hydrolase family protein [Pseudobacillus wudalianchiensis]|uniref:poly-gamma-glutamate hydrolase family protein n=1 Tax=Pseudobacillus wudalianchiensis TaxID=1743143 RepID=UPI00098176CD|nr:poly-gamma-glutamate hydrolase family protein [Bacillus wudalianchiensis]
MIRKILIGTCILLLLIGVGITLREKPKEYRSFTELQKYERENIDYRITASHRKPEIAIMAIHGGNIEIGTGEIAADLGEKLNASTYIFEALKPKDNRKLHITSTLYDEPTAIRMAQKAKTILSLHGYHDTGRENVYIGGRNEAYKKMVKKYLKKEGFQIEEAPKHLKGTNKKNIVNRSELEQGVQLELSTKLRKSFFKDHDFAMNNRKQQTERYDAFVKALEKATLKYKQEELE